MHLSEWATIRHARLRTLVFAQTRLLMQLLEIFDAVFVELATNLCSKIHSTYRFGQRSALEKRFVPTQ
jgi:hypothetical protein